MNRTDLTLPKKRQWLSEAVKYLPADIIDRFYDELSGTLERAAETMDAMIREIIKQGKP